MQRAEGANYGGSCFVATGWSMAIDGKDAGDVSIAGAKQGSDKS
jgi:hypothetical protein